MQTSSRLYHCCRCHAQVIVCSHCDRGQRYCSGACSGLARAESCRRSAKKYQRTWSGRINNAARQQCYRQRIKQKVTHQGSVPKRFHDLLKIQLRLAKKTQKPLVPGDTLQCHHCGEVCKPFLRHDFLHSSRYQQILRRQDPF